MHYEKFLFTRNQRQDFTAFIRPSLLTNKEVSTIGGIFNYVSDITRLTPDFPSLYCFPLGEYVLLLRHYSSERKHAGRAIGVIEGIAVKQGDSEFVNALASFVGQQTSLLNISASVSDIEVLSSEISVEHDWHGSSAPVTFEPFVGTFLERIDQDRLFLPFTVNGRSMLETALADRRFTSLPYFAFGTNSDVLAQLSRHARIDIVSFFKTDRASFRNRRTNSVSGKIDDDEDDTTPDPSMALRPTVQDERNLRPRAPIKAEDDEETDEATMVGSDAISIRSFKNRKPDRPVREAEAVEDEDADNDSTVLTMRQLRDRIRAEEAAARPKEAEEEAPRDPIRWLLHVVSSLFSPNKPK